MLHAQYKGFRRCAASTMTMRTQCKAIHLVDNSVRSLANFLNLLKVLNSIRDHRPTSPVPGIHYCCESLKLKGGLGRISDNFQYPAGYIPDIEIISSTIKRAKLI